MLKRNNLKILGEPGTYLLAWILFQVFWVCETDIPRFYSFSFDLITHNLPTSETPSNPSWSFRTSLKGFANCQVLTPLLEGNSAIAQSQECSNSCIHLTGFVKFSSKIVRELCEKMNQELLLIHFDYLDIFPPPWSGHAGLFTSNFSCCLVKVGD